MKKQLLALASIATTMTMVAQEQSSNGETSFNKENQLEEVIITASKEKQKRKEVPASIGVVTNEEIDQAKPVGIDKIVNNIPGVYMSTSTAASNEQHFMATRSPISTRGLFLYLEDGLPIRPTSVFNHNALLEMNQIAIGRVEILKGPASSIYGSEAVGGSFNFITKNPTKDLSGSVQLQMNTLGLTSTGFEGSSYLTEKSGLYVAAGYAERKNGPFGHSNYEKFATTIKNTNELSERFSLTNLANVIDYRSDMAGSISQVDYDAENYESDQTYTERDAFAVRFRSTLDAQWNKNNKTTVNGIFRYNEMGQIPSYRIRQGENGEGTGEVNNNLFRSYAALAQHQITIPSVDLKIIGGASIDYSLQDYIANQTDIEFDANTGINTGYTVNDNLISNYKANILNYATYAQFDLALFPEVNVNAAVRYDVFEYDYNILAAISEDRQQSGVDRWTNIAPKLGVNYNINNKIGVYSNFTTGFTPPQASQLYRLDNVNEINGDIKPSTYLNYEVGTYMDILKGLRVDVALYQLDGYDTLISTRNDDNVIVYDNAGKTRSRGVEYGLTYQPCKSVTFSHNGSFAEHLYLEYFRSGVDYSDTERETAPKVTGTSKIIISPENLEGFSFGVSHELVGKYNTSFEGQATDNTTATYKGHNIFDFNLNYKIKNVELWGQILNVFDSQYATRASYWRANTYTVGNMRAFHAGIKYNFK